MLDHRQIVDEKMDAADLAPAAHHAALAGLERINRVSRTAGGYLPAILAMARGAGLGRITLLDIAAGGGDVPIALARAAGAHGLHIDLTLLDRSATALAHAGAAAAAAGVSCRTVKGDARALPDESFDVISNSLFLHHLRSSADMVALLSAMRSRARRMVLISDLRRGTLGWLAASIGCRVLSGSPIVHYDGPASVRAALTLAELRAVADRAGLGAARIRPCFPFRILLTWEPGGGDV